MPLALFNQRNIRISKLSYRREKMALINAVTIPPLDPGLITGPFRYAGGPSRMESVTLDADFGEVATWLYVGTSGDVSITKVDGTTQVLTNMAAGIWHRMNSRKVNTAGTTASGLVWGS
jgi:hypothetical protein